MKYSAVMLGAAIVLCCLAACTKEKPSTLSGKIEIAGPSTKISVQPTAALYLIARAAGDVSGPPIAVKRFLPPLHFPLEFTLSSQDEMIPDVPFQGPFALSAHLAQSGSASPPVKGDFVGAASTRSISLGEKDVEIQLAQVKK